MSSKLSLQSTVKLSSGYEMPIFGLGTWRSEPDKVTEAVKFALLNGYKHIDAAWIYENEDEVGAGIRAAMKENPAITRESIFVTTKLWNSFHRPEQVEPAIRDSLKKLGLDYVDLYLIHFPVAWSETEDEVNVTLKDTWLAMENLVKLGLTRSIGVSNYSVQQLEELLGYATILPVTNQSEAHPHYPNEQVYEFGKKHNITFTAYSSLGKVFDGQTSPLDDPKVLEIAKKYKKSPAQLLYRWGLQKGFLLIPKSVNKERIIENTQIFDFEISDSDIAEITSLKHKGDKKNNPDWCKFE
jgi:aldehyde reductase